MRKNFSKYRKTGKIQANPRGLAVKILNRTERDRAFAEPLIDSCLKRNYFDNVSDRRLLTRLVFGVLRMRNRLDWMMRSVYDGNFESMDTGIKNIIRTALYQIMFNDRIPSYAIVDEAVEIAKKMYPGRSGLINAVLRNIIRKMDDIEYPNTNSDPLSYISVYHSHPEWIVKMWMKEIGTEETLSLCKANNEVPPVSLRINRLKTSRDDILRELSDKGYDVKPAKYSPDGIILLSPAGPVGETDWYKNGYVQIQDEASQLISFLVDPKPSEEILDMCAGAGIKTSHMAGLMKNMGKIISVDINRGKIKALKEMSRRLDISIVEPVVGDATKDMGKTYHGRFDRILVDSPCSGLGTLRRNPEIKWNTDPESLKNFQNIQKTILDLSARYLKKGGTIIYSTCTISLCENEKVVKDFLINHPDFHVVHCRNILDRNVTDDSGFLKTRPHRHDTDGFFGAILKKEVDR